MHIYGSGMHLFVTTAKAMLQRGPVQVYDTFARRQVVHPPLQLLQQQIGS